MYRILLIDPDHQSREQTKKMLDWHHYGFTLQDYADTFSTALSLFKQECYELVLINMSQLNDEGLRISEHIRQQSRIPIVLIGGSKEFQIVRRALTLQVSDYLPRPVQPYEFKSSLLSIKENLDGYDGARHKKRMAQRPTNIVDQVKNYVEQALNENITLREISNILHYNYSYLGQKFKDQENMTFNEYLLHRRMEKAKTLLRNTDLKIYEIANEVGYIEIDWFYKKFKEYTGLSANEYRKSVLTTA